MLISNTIPISMNDVIGEVSFVIFFCGCNFKCPFCQNWPLVTRKNEICKVREIEGVIEEIKSVKQYITHVQATGGEPTLQGEAVRSLFSRIKSLELRTSLDTNGSNPEIIKILTECRILDHLAMDIKAKLKLKDYSKVTGLPTKIVKIYINKILESLEIASKLDFVEIRTTYVPLILRREDIFEIADFLSSYLTKKKHFYVIQQFIPSKNAPDPRFRIGKPPAVEELREIAKRVAEKLPNVAIRHIGGVDYM